MNPNTEGARRSVVTIREHETSRAVALSDADVAVLSGLPSRRLEVIPAGPPGYFALRASSWVGAVVLPRLTIQVLPKVDDLRTVLSMFTSGGGLIDWSTDYADYGPAGLVEGVAELVLREISSATRRGLVHGYRHTEERLPTIRGRLDVGQLASRPWEVWPAPCRFDDFTPDIAENRVLLAAVHAIIRWPMGPGVRRLATQMAQRLDGVGDAAAPLLEVRQVRRSPLNEHYRAALALCRLVLEGFGLAQTGEGVTAHTFLVDMNKLFERWIGDELTTRLWPLLRVIEQRTVALSVSPRVTMAPDLVFERDGRVVLVADVKYKLSGSGLARTEDYYQLLAYTTAMRLPHGLLIYCRADESPERVITVVAGGQRLHTHPIDLGGGPSSVARALDGLAAAIRDLVAAGAKRDGADS